MSASELCLRPATEQADAVRNGEVTAVQLLDAVLARVDAHNDAINAVVITQIDDARRRASALDQAFERGEELGPLHGVPVTIKEAFDLAGSPTTWGFPFMATNLASSTAELAERLLAAGANIYGKTNVPVALAEWQSFNPIYGTTNNPWDLTRTPGGSSGGSAASLAAGFAGLELGSDIGASIRNPAHYCGVFGHKPSFGLLPQRGHALPGVVAPTDIAVVGPMARSAADLDVAMTALTTPLPGAPTAGMPHLPRESRTSLADFEVGVMLTSDVVDQDDSLTTCLQTAIDSLVDAGLNVTVAHPPIDQAEAHDNYRSLLLSALGVFDPEDQYRAMAEHGDRWHSGDRDSRAVAGHKSTLSHREWWQAANRREQLRQIWATWFESYDLLLCPTAASTAFTHDERGLGGGGRIMVNGSEERMSDQLFWAGWSCNVYLPATVAPVGLAADGLPAGLQIVAPYMHDRRSIAFAGLIEQTLGGYQVPPGFEALDQP